MQNIMLNNEVQLSRGDTFSTPLFINKGTELKPLRYYLKNSFPIIEKSDISKGSLLLPNTMIMKGSYVNGELYESTWRVGDKLEEENGILILDNSYLVKDSKIFAGSILKVGSKLNGETLKEDIVVCGDEIYLGIMEPNQPFECAILKKKYDYRNVNNNGDVVIKLKSEDTENLIPGTYYYTIKARLLQDDGTYDVNTIITNTQFKIID